MITLRPYQQPLYDEIWKALFDTNEYKNVLSQADTGY